MFLYSDPFPQLWTTSPASSPPPQAGYRSFFASSKITDAEVQDYIFKMASTAVLQIFVYGRIPQFCNKLNEAL